MANKSFTVQYLIKARDLAARNLKKIAKGFNQVDKNAKKAGKTFKRTSSQFTKGFGRMAAAAVGFFSIRGFIRIGSEFQDALADLSSITGATGEDLAFLREESLRLGKASITSQSEVATAFKLIASAKSELLKDPKGLSNVTEQVLLLANAAGIDLTQSAQVVTQSLNQFGVAADQANRFVNVLAAGAKFGASEVGETGIAIIKSGAVAKLAGVGFEELNSAIQVLSTGGIKAEIAGTGLKTALLKLEAQGISRIKPSVVGLSQAFQNLSEMNLDVTAQSKLFGLEAVAVGSILISRAPLIKQWTKALTGTNVAQEQAAVRLKTFSKQAKKVKLIINDALIRTFLALEPTITAAAISFGEFMGQIKPRNIKAIADIFLTLGGALKLVALFLKDVFLILKGIGTIFGQTAGAFAARDFGQFDLKNAFRLFPAENEIDVNMNVALADGLQETQKPVVTARRSRRRDTGVNTK